MTIEGKIWFSPSAKQSPIVKLFWNLFADNGLPFPSSKANAIIVTSHKYQDPLQPIFPVRTGETTLFVSPGFAKHEEAWAVENVEVEIGPIKQTGNPIVDDFNQLVMDVFNLAGGNILKSGNLLSWNVWSTAPELVDQQEWRDHAEKWRKSIDADHGSPDGEGTAPRYFDGSPFEPVEALIDEEIKKIIAFLKKHLPSIA